MTVASRDASLPLLESAPIGVVVIDARGQILLVNQRAELLFQYSRQEMLHQPLEMLLPDSLRDVHRRHRDEYFRIPRTRSMGQGMELAGKRKDGSEFPVEVGLSHTTIGGERVAVSFITDISARVEAVAAMRRHADELEAMVTARTSEIERRRQVAEGLHDILAVLNTARPLEQILDFIVEQAYQLLAPDGAAVYRQNEGHRGPEIRASRGFDGMTPPGSPGVIPGNDGGASPAAREDGESAAGGRFRSVLTVPLNVKGEVYGNICLYYQASRTFTPEEKHLAVSFADQAALAIENARLREQVERSAVASERSRIARELHDAVTQTLFSTSMIAEVLPQIWQKNPEEGRRRLGELQELTRGALAEMRTLLLELRPSALAGAEIGELLRQLAAAVTGRARIPVDVRVEAARALPPDVKIAFYRIAQEALNNVAKHSRATNVRVELAADETGAVLTVQDDGVGFARDGVDRSRMGLRIQQERADAIGAQLLVESQPEEGTTIRLIWRQA